ncbi:hypothetical protein JAAARDRAFT_43174 [Jaapia argillacea MUCL 33604]|uniref:Uncharacterized protein n=1 Tax=Jaapia argillacea MUCL 33604 TaxID=933084 RepID=A0A067P1T5_9AGAM|nr:hypothetical protein JAAARDRAFT_43174 [Jaapia argillacea MUCL 33604]
MYNFFDGSNLFGDPSVEPMAFLTKLAMNASIWSVAMIFYSGNDDSLTAHRGTQDNGEFAGIILQERHIKYALFAGAGHAVPWERPESLMRARNPPGLCISSRIHSGFKSNRAGAQYHGGLKCPSWN